MYRYGIVTIYYSVLDVSRTGTQVPPSLVKQPPHSGQGGRGRVCTHSLHCFRLSNHSPCRWMLSNRFLWGWLWLWDDGLVRLGVVGKDWVGGRRGGTHRSHRLLHIRSDGGPAGWGDWLNPAWDVLGHSGQFGLAAPCNLLQ